MTQSPQTDNALQLGVVIIGRNEGERLVRCLESVARRGYTVVYVDSGSTDSSVNNARALGAEVVELDMSTPFTAARARNEGYRCLQRSGKAVEFVQFVDGDCEMIEQWFDAAVQSFDADVQLSAVCGILHERFPEASIYNQICDLEWPRQVGEVHACGGIFVVRAEAFDAVGGFDPTVPAGEEPELCQRLRAEGWVVRRIDQPMCLHDSAMLRFSQWWRRQVRTGYSGWDVARRFGHGPDRPFVRTVVSARLWACGVPLVALLLGVALGLMVSPVLGLVVAAAVLSVLPLQALRIAIRTHRAGRSWRFAIVYGALTVLGKFAQMHGQVRYAMDLVRGRGARIVEHKAMASQQSGGSVGS